MNKMSDMSDMDNISDMNADKLFLKIKKDAYIKTRTRVKLSKGGESNFYFDNKQVTLDPEGINIVADRILDIMENEHISYIGGPESGSIPIVAAVVTKSLSRPAQVYGFFVRKNPRTHGRMLNIEGKFRPGEKAVLVDDTTTTGGSLIDAYQEVVRSGGEVPLIISLVDREEGARENIEKRGIRFISLYRKSDFD